MNPELFTIRPGAAIVDLNCFEICKAVSWSSVYTFYMFTRWMFWSLLVPALGVGSPQFGIVGIASVLFALLPTPQLECFCMSQKSID